ncbi:hypothetical protein [Singulisphaera acidiphila]|uniref:Uncharacterized protein n=1 Tax=Singulisphaera acidiphila (strain ATCC BAA-1392 / DSM 18658 / VKM B-2454 / MOB10) TaxID=886293 RepID=L0DRR5_SINAD|nr:hypothetical protein [Singulisphaera acidiphila]AGA31076.1 hypothetical protein Sinac_7021 [Singulisphaera acidiphila DSM 18658]
MSGLQSGHGIAVASLSDDLGKTAVDKLPETDSRVRPRDLAGRGVSGGNQGRGHRPGSVESSALAEQELREAIQSYQEKSGRMFPTWSEVLEVLQSLGYRKPGEEKNPSNSLD